MTVSMQVGEVGKPIEVTVTGEDLTGATSLSFHLTAPSGATKTFTPTVTSVGPPGVASYTTAAASDIDEKGWWEIQFYYTVAGVQNITEVGEFEVGRVI